MLSTWYFYWHNKLTNEKGHYMAFTCYLDVKDTLYDMAEQEKGLHWFVAEGEHDEHPCNKECRCKSHTETWVP